MEMKCYQVRVSLRETLSNEEKNSLIGSILDVMRNWSEQVFLSGKITCDGKSFRLEFWFEKDCDQVEKFMDKLDAVLEKQLNRTGKKIMIEGPFSGRANRVKPKNSMCTCVCLILTLLVALLIAAWVFFSCSARHVETPTTLSVEITSTSLNLEAVSEL